ncbi:MAG: ABC transporter substrate-binding protein, partial [Simkaniaceae bacterium]|nr:ABC transporter substrate-binding protein [Simkaniaceae bacterium]
CKYNISVVFPESNVSSAALKKISCTCRDKGVEIHIAKTPLYGDSMGECATYLDMIEHNVNTLMESINHE